MPRFRRAAGSVARTRPGSRCCAPTPTSLEGGSGKADTIFPTERFAGVLIAAGISILGIPPTTATTPWVEHRDAYQAACSSEGGANVLQVTPLGSSPVIRPSPDATWGPHLVDANIALGNLVGLVDRQAERWADRHEHHHKGDDHQATVHEEHRD